MLRPPTSLPSPAVPQPAWRSIALGVIVIGVVGVFDYATGVELRVFPLYFVPVGLVAWRTGNAGSFAVSLVGIAAWEISNRLAGMQYGSRFVEVWNVVVQWASLATFAAVIARLRVLMDHERARAREDPLTGLANGLGFFETLAFDVERARRYRRPMTFAFIDLDNFKVVNDTQGHSAGDEVLVTFATLLREGCRRVDRSARLGGDEFALLLPETNSEQARALLERLQEKVRTTMRARGWPVTASIGAVSFDSVPATVTDIVSRADEVMYAVKSSGKDGFRVVSGTTPAAAGLGASDTDHFDTK